MQAIVGFGILNWDHFTIKSNNEKILIMQKEIDQKLPYEAFNHILKAMNEQNSITRQMLQEYKSDAGINFERLEKQCENMQNRIDKIFDTYGIGTVRGDDFEIDYSSFTNR